MPRPRKAGAPEPKRRSRWGCHACKQKKIKCGEEKPACENCRKRGIACDYSLVLRWNGRGEHQTIASNHMHTPFQARIPHKRTYSASTTEDASSSTESSTEGNHPSRTPPSGFGPHLFGSFSQYPEEDTVTPNNESEERRKRRRLHGISTTQGTAFSNVMTPPPSTLRNAHSFFNWQDTTPTLYAGSSTASISPSESKLRFGENDAKLNSNALTPSHTTSQTFYHGQGVLPFRSGLSPVIGPEAFGTPLLNATPGFLSSPYPPPLDYSAGFSPSNEEPKPPLQPWIFDHSGCPASTPTASSQVFFRSATIQPRLQEYIKHEPNVVIYGYDQAKPDIDMPNNDDAHALACDPHEARKMTLLKLPAINASPESDQSFGFGVRPRGISLERAKYYAAALPITLPAPFAGLSPKLKANPMNLLYFHHFLNHTARVLVPHDCQENAFRTILPQMALENDNLLSLILAYSANHRARLLKYPEPKTRIAYWVKDVFPSLRRALEAANNSRPSDADVAAAIMLASLEIISPNAFDMPNMSWEQYLLLARQIIVARGGYHVLRHGDKVSYFLSRWFAYLDVLGSLSGSTYQRPLIDDHCTCDEEHDFNKDDEIDCFLGFTGRCISILSQVANLAKDCDNQRRYIEITDSGQKWKPDEHIKIKAAPLEAYLRNVKPTTYRGCSHRRVKSDAADTATNKAFHNAGLIHLYRRVLAYPTEAKEVQDAVRAVQRDLERVDERSICCMIFPAFSAGCEAQDKQSRKIFFDCLKKAEHMGMAAAKSAKKLMEKAWETGRPWQELRVTEFVG